jgi:CubicO group peptidase (beta-lactamase class C family)
MMTQIHGHCDERFKEVKDAFAQNFEDDRELGAAFAVTLGGKMVVDLWAGHASADKSSPWVEDTVVPVASSSKIPISLCGLMLIDRGLIDLDEPVATYWSEFAAAGKDKMPVRYIFSHSAGLPGLDNMPDLNVLNDWDEVAKRLAAQKPWWEPGTQSGYHAMTVGNLLGELVRRTTGKTIETFFKDEIAGRFGIDFTFGVSDTLLSRLSETEDGDDARPPSLDETSMMYKAYLYLMCDNGVFKKFNPRDYKMPAGNGLSNARALAQIGSILSTRHIGGQEILGHETAALPYQEQIYKTDLIMNMPVRWGVGFGMTSNEIPIPWPHAFHWGGRGGSSVVMIPELGVSWSYTPNRFLSGVMGDPRSDIMGSATTRCLRKLKD